MSGRELFLNLLIFTDGVATSVPSGGSWEGATLCDRGGTPGAPPPPPALPPLVRLGQHYLPRLPKGLVAPLMAEAPLCLQQPAARGETEVNAERSV